MEDAKTDSVNLAVNLAGGAVASLEHGAGGLLPCPFCGGEAQTDFIAGQSYIIECYRCEARTDLQGSPDDAIAAWNRRAPVAQLSAQTAEPSLSDEEIAEIMAAQHQDAYHQLQALKNPYTTPQEAHVWDMAIIEAMRILHA